MDIAALSIASSQFKLQQQVQLSMINKVMELSEANSNSIQKMLEGVDVKAIQQSIQSHLGASIDVEV